MARWTLTKEDVGTAFGLLDGLVEGLSIGYGTIGDFLVGATNGVLKGLDEDVAESSRLWGCNLLVIDLRLTRQSMLSSAVCSGRRLLQHNNCFMARNVQDQ